MNHTNEAPTNNKQTEQEEPLEQQSDNRVSQNEDESTAEKPQAEDESTAEELQAEGESAVDETNAVESELEQARKLAEENYQRFLRVQADFDNFRKRSRQEREEFTKYASTKLIEQLLPVVDNLERALVVGSENKDADAILRGVEMIFRLMNQVLEQEGLKPIEAVGQPFNPEYHQAIMQVESDEHDEGIVVEEVQKGYILKERVLRPSMVKVSS